MGLDPALERFIRLFKSTVADALFDSWFIVDADRNIVEFNRVLFSLVPRHVGRALKGKKCYDVLELDICKDHCIAHHCWRDRQSIRLDEIKGRSGSEGQPLRFALSAVPIFNDEGREVGALEIQRNVTDEAVVQGKYQEMLDSEARERERLLTQIRVRTKELLEVNEILLRTQRELAAFKKGLLV